MRMRILFAVLLAAATAMTNVAIGENIAYGVGVVVIDPGHGGKIPGAHYGNVCEKDIVLKVALKLGRMIEQGMPGVKVVYTRTTDEMLGATKTEDLEKRARIANTNRGELFLSIHANAAESRSARGVEILVMGETPKEQRFNTNVLYQNNREDLIDLDKEPDAPIVRARIQNMQYTYGEYSMAIARCIERNFRKSGREVRRIKPQLLRVLYGTDMPGVLTEIGFMSNPQELAYMKSDKGQTEIARNLYRAVREYADYVLGTRQGDGETAAGGAEGTSPAGNTAAGSAGGSDAPSGNPAAGANAQAGKGGAGSSGKASAAHADGSPAGSAAKGTAAKGSAAGSPAKGSAADAAAPVRYTVQVLSTDKVLPADWREFGSYRGRVKRYRGRDGLYKYCVGEYDSPSAAKRQAKKVGKVLKGAFVVRFRGTEIVQ